MEFSSLEPPPKYPLPEELQDLSEEDSSCRYCGIPYLIRSEVSKMQRRMAEMEDEVETHQTCKLELSNLIALRCEISGKDSHIEQLKNDISTLKETLIKKDNSMESLKVSIEKEMKEIAEMIALFDGSIDVKLKEQNEIFSNISQHTCHLEKTISERNQRIMQQDKTIMILEMKAKGAKDESIEISKKLEETKNLLDKTTDKMKRLELDQSQSEKIFHDYELNKQNFKEIDTQLQFKRRELESTISAHNLQIRDLQMKHKQEREEWETNELERKIRIAIDETRTTDKKETDIIVRGLNSQLEALKSEIVHLKKSTTDEREEKEKYALNIRKAYEKEKAELQKEMKRLEDTFKSDISRKDTEISILKSIVKKECHERNELQIQISRLKDALPKQQKVKN